MSSPETDPTRSGPKASPPRAPPGLHSIWAQCLACGQHPRPELLNSEEQWRVVAARVGVDVKRDTVTGRPGWGSDAHGGHS